MFFEANIIFQLYKQKFHKTEAESFQRQSSTTCFSAVSRDTFLFIDTWWFKLSIFVLNKNTATASVRNICILQTCLLCFYHV